MKKTLFICFLTICNLVQAKDGPWFKLTIPQTGVYKIDQNTLKNAGIDPSKTKPSEIRLFVSPLKLLPQKITETPHDALIEIPVLLNDQNEAWDAQDYVLFYAEDPHSITFQNLQFHLQPHPYAKNNCVFMQIGNSEPKHIPSKVGGEYAPKEIESLAYFEAYAPEINNLLSSGREWYGEYFFSEYSHNIDTPGRLTTKPMQLYTRFIGQTYENTQVEIFADGKSVGTQSLSKIDYKWNDPYRRYRRAGEISEGHRTVSNTNGKIKISFQLPHDLDISSGVYVDQLEWAYPRKIEAFHKQYQAYLLGREAISFRMPNADEHSFVWQISSSTDYRQLKPDGHGLYQVKPDSSISKLAFFAQENIFPVPEIQAVHWVDFAQIDSPDLLIVYPEYFKEEVEKLADFRRTHDKLDVQIADINDIYNWFSGGKQDLSAIRNLCRNLWLKGGKLKYLLLFGDANFDFKNISNSDYVFPDRQIPTYESRESLEPIYSYSSDDYFGFLEDHEGEWPEGRSISGYWQSTANVDHTLDIAVGRLPVKDRLEAQQLVAKIIHYGTNQSAFGQWKRRATFIADDGDNSTHVYDAEAFSHLLGTQNEAVQTQKIYVDSYPQIETEQGERVPRANEAFEKAMREGTFIVNYNGHGAENGWTDEKLLTIGQTINWKNLNKLPIFFTATCQFGRYDNPSQVSGAELALLNPDGGAIALLTTTRPVFSSTNYRINQAFYTHLFGNKHIGDVFRKTKNASIKGELNRNFTLLGDPSMAIAYPQNRIILTHINGKAPDKALIKGLELVTLSGMVESSSNFNGTLSVSLYDKEDTLYTLGQNENKKTAFLLHRNKLFEGKAKVAKGLFSLSFQMPQHIDTTIGLGHLFFYALSTDSTQEAIGGNRSFSIGQLANSEDIDHTPPQISFHFDEKTKALVFDISDESGINISPVDPNHEIVLVLDDTLHIVANEHYEAQVSRRGGRLTFPITDNLTNVSRKVELKVSDLYNNRTRQSFSFIVKAYPFELAEVRAFPNPVKDIFNVSFEHNRVGQNLRFQLRYFDNQGRAIRMESKECYICPKRVSFGTNLGVTLTVSGKYYYKIVGYNLDNTEKAVHSDRLFFWK